MLVRNRRKGDGGANRPVHVIALVVRATTSVAGAMMALIVAQIALSRAMHSRVLRDPIRRFNRRRFNPLTLRIAGNRARVYAAVHHIGRRSGRPYTTPVVARPYGDGFVIPLPYGTAVDWCENVRAAGGCVLTWNGRQYHLGRPEIVASASVVRAFPWAQRVISGAGGIRHYLVLHEGASRAGAQATAAALARQSEPADIGAAGVASG